MSLLMRTWPSGAGLRVAATGICFLMVNYRNFQTFTLGLDRSAAYDQATRRTLSRPGVDGRDDQHARPDSVV